MGDKIRLKRGDLNDVYEPTDSEDEYTEKEKYLLAKAVRKQVKHIDSEDEVLAFSESDLESVNDGPKNADSDIEDADEDLPDTRAWGRHRGVFHSTDYVDKDYGGFTGHEEEIAEQEELEARALQERLAKQLDEADFTLDIFSKKEDLEVEDHIDTVVKTDLSGLSKRQKLQLFQKESPEFTGLTGDFKEKLEHLQTFLEPLMDLKRKGVIPDCLAMEFISTQYHLVLNYCVNISFYLLLKSKRISVQNHPVVKRLYQYRQLLTQLQPTYEEKIEPQINKILGLISDGKMLPVITNSERNLTKNSKKLNLLSTQQTIVNGVNGSVHSSEDENGVIEPPNKKLKFDNSDSESQEEPEPSMELEKVPINDDGDGKRKITYQIAKNKGLTPHRKKEQRNPRVKHRNKFRKAKIRRKGAVREVRTETSRYGGEMSGIKATVKKSVKIK